MRRFKGDDLFGVLIGGFELEKHLAPFNDGETPGHIPVKGFKITPEPDSETVAHLFCRRHKLRQFAELHMAVHKGGVINESLHFGVKILKVFGVKFRSDGKTGFILDASIAGRDQHRLFRGVCTHLLRQGFPHLFLMKFYVPFVGNVPAEKAPVMPVTVQEFIHQAFIEIHLPLPVVPEPVGTGVVKSHKNLHLQFIRLRENELQQIVRAVQRSPEHRGVIHTGVLEAHPDDDQCIYPHGLLFGKLFFPDAFCPVVAGDIGSHTINKAPGDGNKRFFHATSFSLL